MSQDRVLDGALIEEMLMLLPAEQQAQLFLLAMDEGASDEQAEQAVREALAAIDWEGQKEAIRGLISKIMPLETLVPEVYAEWRPVIRDAVAYTGSMLSVERLVPKLLEQMLLPEQMPLEQRLLKMIAQMPSLQKIGQIVARNPNLDPDFRAELTRLENAIEDISPDEVMAEIERQLGRYLRLYQVEIEPVNLAEASVSAVMRFTWLNPVSRKRERGVFKVLKPYVVAHFPEEMTILQGLADFFDSSRDQYDLPALGFREVMNDVRRLLEREVDLPAEQANLVAAEARYAEMKRVRVPHLIPELSTSTITAMSEIDGVKVTDAYPQNKAKLQRLAATVIEALIAMPMFDRADRALLHADPHAGNLFVEPRSGEVVILDWALTEHLSREQRRQTVLLTLGVALRDEERIVAAINALSLDDLVADATKGDVVRGQAARLIASLSPLEMPGFSAVMRLLDGIAFAGVRFPAELLMFRKVLFTLEGVLHDIAPDLNMDLVLARYALKLMPKEAPRRLLRPFSEGISGYRMPLSNFDLTALAFTLPLLGNRLWLQSAERATRYGLVGLHRAWGAAR